jgi:hypothetical protein
MKYMNKKLLVGLTCVVMASATCSIFAQNCYNLTTCGKTYHGKIGICVPDFSASATNIPDEGSPNPKGWIIGSFGCGVLMINGDLTPIFCGDGVTIDQC